MGILNAVMVPHPPLIVPEVGRGEERKIQRTIDAFREAARFVFDAKPDAIVITTPHSAMYADWFHISPGERASGSFAKFGAGSVRIDIRYDWELVRAICRLARERKFPAGTEGQKGDSLDHATLIPLFFLREAYGNSPLPPIVTGSVAIVIGISLAKTALDMASANWLVAVVTLVATVVYSVYLRGRGFWAMIPVLLGALTG